MGLVLDPVRRARYISGVSDAHDKLDPAALRSYAQRDWQAPERLARGPRAKQSVQHKVALAIELYEASRVSCPGWPDEATRQADMASHVRVCALLRRAADVGAR